MSNYGNTLVIITFKLRLLHHVPLRHLSEILIYIDSIIYLLNIKIKFSNSNTKRFLMYLQKKNNNSRYKI